MQHEFAYECPHCHETVRITDDVLGEVVDCPACGSPFQVDIPSAKPAAEGATNSSTPTLDRADREESELKHLHPAMLRSHPMFFLGYWALVLLGGAAIVLAVGNYEFVSKAFQIAAGAILAGIGGVLLLKWWLETRWTTLIVTTKRTILRKGIIARSTTEVQHDDVRNIQVHQNMYERVARVGDLAVSSSGQDELEIHINGIPEPEEVAETIRDLQ